MRDFEYFATFDESVEIVRALTDGGLRIIVEPQLAEAPQAMTFTAVDESLTNILKRAPVFYVAGPFTKFDIAFSQLTEGTAKGKYAINWLTQGPILQCIVGRINEVDGVPCLLPGDVSYQDAYRNPETNVWEKPSAEVKAAFRTIVSIVKERCPPFEHKPGVKIFIGPKARALLEAKAVNVAAD